MAEPPLQAPYLQRGRRLSFTTVAVKSHWGEKRQKK
jgi:hypothetical protein